MEFLQLVQVRFHERVWSHPRSGYSAMVVWKIKVIWFYSGKGSFWALLGWEGCGQLKSQGLQRILLGSNQGILLHQTLTMKCPVVLHPFLLVCRLFFISEANPSPLDCRNSS